jgi:hypothetical protein
LESRVEQEIASELASDRVAGEDPYTVAAAIRAQLVAN